VTTIDVSGIRKLAADLERNAPRVGRLAAVGVRATAVQVERTMKANAPVLSGALRDSIVTDIYGGGNSRGVSAVIGPTAEYGAIVEHGYANNPPQPYAGPAMDAHTQDFVAAMERAADTAARQALG
jgi:HK97 gp10 family phage protein